MNKSAFGPILVLALVVSACGQPLDQGGTLLDPDAAVLQVRSEGGFAPVEWVLGRGPTYTLLGDGRLIVQGPVIEIYPGPLLPNYQVGRLTAEEMQAILDLVDEMGLPDITMESDDSAAQYVADATTEVVTYWDSDGEHMYSAYALGIELAPSNPRTAAFSRLVTALDQATATLETTDYGPETLRVIAGVSFAVPEPGFEDVRPWPLDDDLDTWTELPNGWLCTTVGAGRLDLFQDATQVTEWLHPDPMMDAPTFKLLVRPLLPGETDCPVSS